MPTQEVLSTQALTLLFVAATFGLAAIALLAATFFTVEQRTTAIVQRLGKFRREAGPGLHAKVPFIDRVIGRVNLRVQQLDVRIETKTPAKAAQDTHQMGIPNGRTVRTPRPDDSETEPVACSDAAPGISRFSMRAYSWGPRRPPRIEVSAASSPGMSLGLFVAVRTTVVLRS